MIDIKKSKEYFKEYIKKYDLSHPRINMKTIHMYHVAENAKKIANMLNLSENDQNLAELIGLLHDLGRFEQWKLYETFSDKLSIDHGQKSVEVLFSNKEIRNFVEDDKYDAIIFKAINNHNKLEIERGLSKEELLHAKIIRDADNLDIFRGLLEDTLESHTQYGSQNVSVEVLSDEYFEKFKQEKVLKYGDAKNDMEIMVAIIAHIYAINFSETLQLLKKSDYINKLVKKIDAKDEFTKQKLEEIADYAMKYIERKLE